MTTPIYRLLWDEGLCRDGCGLPVNERRRFINGHDGKLFDLLVDLVSDGAVVEQVLPGGMEVDRFTPLQWAKRSFSAAGVAHFEWLLLRGDRRVSPVDSLPADLDRTSLLWDLEELRGAVAAIADSAVSGEEVEGAQELVDSLRDQVLGLQSQIADLKTALERAEAPLFVDAGDLASLSDRDALRAVRARVSSAAGVLFRSKYEGDHGELVDLLQVFDLAWVDPVRVRAARALLGQEGVS